MAAKLTLGWVVNNALAPTYWLDPRSRAGAQSPADLVTLDAAEIGGHTAVVAQSGSGKSFFLGRLIEEILLATRARCVVLDPNADFRRVHEALEARVWPTACYDHRRGLGRLPHEPSRSHFLRDWTRISKRVYVGPGAAGRAYTPLRLTWHLLSPEILAEAIQAVQRPQIYHCHAFVGVLAELLGDSESRRSTDLLDRAEQLLASPAARGAAGPELGLDVEEIARRMASAHRDRLRQHEPEGRSRAPVPPLGRLRRHYLAHVRAQLQRARVARRYITAEMASYYFAKAREYHAERIFAPTGLHRSPRFRPRLEVYDLPSVPTESMRLLAVNSVLAAQWNEVRGDWADAVERPRDEDYRVPTFIIVDEAHNLMPREPPSTAHGTVRQIFRTIAAEGRKYGLFLILVTQRPDKIDPLVLSECQSAAILRLGSAATLHLTQTLLGVEDVPQTTLGKCLEFQAGRALLVGDWVKHQPTLLFTAVRRTLEGGGGLRSSYWAVSGLP